MVASHGDMCIMFMHIINCTLLMVVRVSFSIAPLVSSVNDIGESMDSLISSFKSLFSLHRTLAASSEDASGSVGIQQISFSCSIILLTKYSVCTPHPHAISNTDILFEGGRLGNTSFDNISQIGCLFLCADGESIDTAFILILFLVLNNLCRFAVLEDSVLGDFVKNDVDSEDGSR